MAMLTAFYSALSWLNANALYLSIIGNNLANLNTIGFKTNLTTFDDLLSQTLGVATNGRGSIAGGNLEPSNVDIAQEFTNIITAQRGYQANSRVITTADELVQDAIAIKR